MRLKPVSVVVMVTLVLVLGSVAAFGTEVDPTVGTVRAKLVPSSPATDPTAHGNVIINYVKGKETFEIQANVVKLSVDTRYGVVLYNRISKYLIEFEFWTDEFGSGNLHVSYVGSIDSFNVVSVRLYGKSGTTQLLSDPPGSLRQSPSKRSKE